MALTILAAASLLLATSVANAFIGTCLLEVDRTRYLDGPCNVEMSDGGSFSIGAGETSRSEYFAYVTVGQGASEATGFWNGPLAEDRAHTDLGALKREGACWINANARVCAWRD